MLFWDVVVTTGQIVVGLAFLYAGLHKLADLDGTQIAILDYRVGPAWLAKLLAPVLSIAEIAVGIAVVLGITVALPVALFLLGGMSVAAGLALIRGLKISCHCFGSGERLTWLTLARNAAFGSILACALWLAPHGWPTVLEPQLLLMPLPQQIAIGLVLTAAFVIAGLLVTLRQQVLRRGASG